MVKITSNVVPPSLWLPFGLVLAVAALPGRVQAQAYYQPRDPMVTASTGRGQYGGGFIELLMTGRDPSPQGRGGVIYNAPPQQMSAPGRVRAPVAYADPMTGQPVQGRGQYAALGQPEAPDRPIEKVLDPRFHKQEVAYSGPHAPGTLIIDTPRRFLFLVQPGGTAMRYGIGVGRPGFEWAGVKSVTRKAEWPNWTPPPEMLKRRPDLPRFMPGGPDNPMGARAMYLGSSLYRIHGTNEPHTIGQAVSSGCIRMVNDDVIDLYGRVRVGMKVIVI